MILIGAVVVYFVFIVVVGKVCGTAERTRA